MTFATALVIFVTIVAEIFVPATLVIFRDLRGRDLRAFGAFVAEIFVPATLVILRDLRG